MGDDYADLADDYHWLLDDDMLSGDWFVDAHRSIFEALPAGAAILDCACGTGNVALALARRGFDVHGSDASDGMIRNARSLARAQGAPVSFRTVTWERLPEAFRQQFDLVVCAGNSLAHCADETAMIAALRGMAAVLQTDGCMLLDSRNWEKLRAERPPMTVLDPRVRHGQRCIPTYVWHIPDAWDQPHSAEIVLAFEHGKDITVRRYPIRFVPFRFDELRDRLAVAGLQVVETDYAKDRDRYAIVVGKT